MGASPDQACFRPPILTPGSNTVLRARQTSRALLTLAAAEFTAGVVFVAWLGFLQPLSRPAEETESGLRGGRTSWSAAAAATSPALPGDELERLVSKPLRRSLAATSPLAAGVAPDPTAPPAAFPPLVLVGSIGNSLAMLRTADGTVQVRSVGESIAGATVRSVSRERVEFDWNGRRVSIVRAAPAAAVHPATQPAPAKTSPPTGLADGLR